MIQSSRNRGEIGDEAITPRPDGTPTVSETLAEIAQLADAAADIAGRFLRDRGMATEVARAKDAVYAHAAYLQAVVQNAGHAIITLQADTVGDWNAAAERLLGVGRAAAQGQHIRQALSAPHLAPLLERLVTTEMNEEFVTEITPPGGVGYSVQWKFTHAYDTRGIPVARVLIGEDVTELRRSRARYEAIVESQVEFVIRRTPDRVITFVNEGFCLYFQKSREELLGTKWVAPVHEDDLEAYMAQLSSLGVANQMITPLLRMRVDGQVRWTRWTIRCIADASGKVVEFQGVGRDVTDPVLSRLALEQHAFEKDIETRISRLAVSAGSLSEKAHKIAKEARALFEADCVEIRLLDRRGRLAPLAMDGDLLSNVYGDAPAVVSPRGIVARALNSREPVFVEDITSDPVNYVAAPKDRLRQFGIRSSLAVPLIASGGAIGVFMIVGTTPRIYSDAELQLAAKIGGYAALVIDAAMLQRKIEEHSARRKTLIFLGTLLAGSLDADGIYKEIVSAAATLLDALSVGILRVNDDDTATLTAASNESDVKRRMPTTFPLAGSHAGGCVKSKAHLEVLGTNRLAKSPVFGTIQEVDFRALNFEPILVEGKVVAVLWATREEPTPMSPESRELLAALAGLSGIAFRNSLLFSALSEETTAVVKARLAELRG